MIYLDNAATTPMDPRVIEVVSKSMKSDFGNSGTVYRIGLDAKNKVELAKEKIAECLNLPKYYDLIFTSGGSEANNLFIKGYCYPNKTAAHIGLEHPSILNTLVGLNEDGPTPISLLDRQQNGRLDISAISDLNKDSVKLLCLSHVNHELGTIQNLINIGRCLRGISPKPKLFVDGVQAFGKIKFSPTTWEEVDGYSLSAHKFNGPKGIGLLLYDSRLQIAPLIHGGKQQSGVRSGTLPVPLILGLAKAVEITNESIEENQEKFRKLRMYLIEGLKLISSRIAELNIRFNPDCSNNSQSSAILNFSFYPVEGEVILHHLEQNDIFVGLGSACSAHSKEPSKILTGIGLSDQEARCSLRVSFGHGNTENDIKLFLEAFEVAYRKVYPSFCQKISSP